MNFISININDLKASEYNPRKDLQPHDREYQKIKSSINEFGYVEPVIVNKDMTIIGGHQRVKVLKDLGFDKINCVVIDIDKTKEKALNIALNKISGEWDTGKLEALLKELKNIDDFDIELTGFDIEEIENLFGKEELTAQDDNFDIDKAIEDIQDPITKPGDIWILGKHRLMCGDSTKQEDVSKLMNNHKAKLIITDPPYNVNYEGKNGMKIKNDHMNNDMFYEFLKHSFLSMYEAAEEGCPFYIFFSESEGINFRQSVIDVGFKLAECLVWVKNSFVLGRQDYHWRHEPILYGWKEGAAHHWYGNRDKDTVIEDNLDIEKLKKQDLVELLYRILDKEPSTVLRYNKPLCNDIHPTMKPIELIGKLINNSSKQKDIVIDLFGGSGSTLITCEQLDRVCCTMELDPKYCDAIIQRYEALTGQKAIRE